jgi:hypothetical protein
VSNKRNNKKSVYCHEVKTRFEGTTKDPGIYEYVHNEAFLMLYISCVIEKTEKNRENMGQNYCTPAKFQNHQVFQQKLIIIE